MKHIKKIKSKVKAVAPKNTNKFLDSLYDETSKGLTDNGAVTFTRSGSPLLDFYAQAGAMRKAPQVALDLFKKAYAEDNLKAVKILFYLRDVRGGQGERELFRSCLGWLGVNQGEVFEKIIKYVSEYGRWDDLFFDNEACFELISKQLKKDVKSDAPTLLAKWLPTINASSDNTKEKAKFMAKGLGLSPIQYRKTVRKIRKQIKAVEELMSSNKWNKIDYSAVPSQAARIYKDAFKKHDEKRYDAFVTKAEKGEVKINTATLYPHQIYKSAHDNYSKTLEALWNQLPDYTRGNNALVVADVSGSMSGEPISVSVSLALYFADRNKGNFKDHFITFSEKPVLQRIVGKTLLEKMNSIESSQWDMNTNLQAVFDTILASARKSQVAESEMPDTLYIISDMEFDNCCSHKTNFEVMEEKYAQFGYKLPNVVFWNVNASGKNLPVQKNKEGVSLVSGFSPVIFRLVVEGKTAEQVMLDTINSERYAKIKI